MAKPSGSTGLDKLAGLATRFGAFVAERHPFALDETMDAFEAVTAGRAIAGQGDLDALRGAFRHELSRRLESRPLRRDLADPTPRVTAEARLARAHAELIES